LVGAFFGDRVPTNFDGAKQTDEKMYAKFFHAMLSESVAMAPGAYEALFVGLRHDDRVMEQLAESAMRAAQRATR
jgi:glutamate-1-semialdehyde 2,1-aminomutase